jgi:hypothetical protein
MNKQSSEVDKTVVMSDEFLNESGLQGGKIIGEHLALASLIVGIPFFLIGLYVLVNIFFDLGVPRNTAIIIGAVLIFIIGVLLIIGGFLIYTDKHTKIQ